MFQFDDVIESLSALEGVSFPSKTDGDHVIFSKGDTKFLLIRPDKRKGDSIFKTDFSIALASGYTAIEEDKIPYLKLLEITNRINFDSSNPCKVSYRKENKLFAIEISHLLYGEGSSTHDHYFIENKNSYLSMAILGMLVLLLEASEMINQEINTYNDGLKEGLKNEKNK
ncbi:TPA: hypothetical protein JD264_05760 [Serratia fonticola]|nr:hypothetical protein [Serratia fonticola]